MDHKAEPPAYRRHRPEQTALYALVAEHYPRFMQAIEASGGHLPGFVQQDFEDYLACGLLEHGFLRVKCDGCRNEHLIAFSCKRRGFCPSCGARRMVESTAHLVDHVFPEAPVRQFVLTFPFPLRFLLAAQPRALTEVLAVVQRAISTFLIRRSGFTVTAGAAKLGTAPQAGIRDAPGHPLSMLRINSPCRHRILSSVRRPAAGDCLHRGAVVDSQDSGSCAGPGRAGRCARARAAR